MPGFKRSRWASKESSKDDEIVKLNDTCPSKKSLKASLQNLLNKKKTSRFGGCNRFSTLRKSTLPTTELEMEEDCENDNQTESTEFTTFEVFDGTTPAANSQFADFIFEGDESDQEADRAETEYWAGCQG